MKTTIEKLSIFKQVDKSTLALLENISKIVNFKKGDILQYEGDDANSIHYLVKGEIKVFKVNRFENEIFLYSIEKDMLISEINDVDFTNVHCFANMEFMESSEVILFKREEFKEICMKNISLLHALISQFSRRNQLIQRLVNREIVYDGSAKVAYMLFNDIERFNTLKKQEIAYFLNIQPETLSRILKKLERKNIIKFSKNHNIVINDHKALKEIFQ